MATYEEEQKTLLNNNQWQDWQNNSLAKQIKQANNGAIWKNAVAKQNYVNKLKSKNTAIRPYYYQQGSQYGLDKNAIDRLFGYDNGTGRVSFDGEDLGKPVVEDNGTSYWDETYLSNKWNDFVKKNGLNKVGAKSQNNSTVTEGFRPYDDVNNIYKQKQNWASAAAKGDTIGQNAAANAALKYYNSLRENGYGSVADELEAADGSDDFAKKYYGMIGLVPFRDYLYQKGAADGLSKSDIDKRISYNDVTGEVSFNGQNLGKPLSEIDGTSYQTQDFLDKVYQNFYDNGGSELMSPKSRYNQIIDSSYRETTENRNNSEAEEKQLRGYYDNLVKQVLGGLDGVDVAKNASESKDYQNAFKATMAKYDLSALQGRDNAAASAAASNGGNIDSYAAANAARQQAALTAEGLAAASKMGLDAYNASLNAYNSRVDRVKEILSDLGVRNDSAANIRRGYTQDRNNLAQMVFDNDQTEKLNDVKIEQAIADMTGDVATKYTLRNNPYFNEDGTLNDYYTSKEFDDAGGFTTLIKNLEASGDYEGAEKARVGRFYKINGAPDKYGQYMSDGNYSAPKTQRTVAGRDADIQYETNVSNLTGTQSKARSDAANPFCDDNGNLMPYYRSEAFDNNGGFAKLIEQYEAAGNEQMAFYARAARTKKLIDYPDKYGQYDDGNHTFMPTLPTADIDQANKDRQSAQDIAFNQTDTDRYITDREVEADKYATDAATDAAAAANSGSTKNSGTKSSGSKSSGKKSNGSKNDGSNDDSSGNMEAWVNWANGRKKNFEYDSSTGNIKYVGDENFDTQVVLVQAALNDGNLTDSEKKSIANLFSASVYDEALGRIRRGQGN